MQNITTDTGYGYIEDGKSNVVCKCTLPSGVEYPLEDGYTFVEVADLDELDGVPIHDYSPPAPRSIDKLYYDIISKETKALVLESLDAKGFVDASGTILPAGIEYLEA